MAPTSGQGHIEETRATAASGALAGASSSDYRERRGSTPRRSRALFAALASAIAVSAGCASDDSSPDRLLDGSEAGQPPVELQGVDGTTVLTKVRVVEPSDREQSARSKSCLDQGRGAERPSGPSVERVGVISETVTFEEESSRSVFGCDNSPGPREANRRWCGGAYGLLKGGRLLDPRLDILCGTTEERVGFVWVHPGPDARYVSVEQPGYVEVYEVAGELPIRVATASGVEYERFRASFDLFEHDSDGKLLRGYELEAFVAG